MNATPNENDKESADDGNTERISYETKIIAGVVVRTPVVKKVCKTLKKKFRLNCEYSDGRYKVLNVFDVYTVHCIFGVKFACSYGLEKTVHAVFLALQFKLRSYWQP